ncbi:hypothetical protein HDV57DRAFT_509118 [Trichoderma longibrachiatum]|uniref:peptidylprolyl isomerase n=1 Tax=Trichoderma longibrachiatum ATCC 18648 TaxID=983965 RepID=A0A2T4CGA7_TRILO|nr:hypothetical protein M440DRAFT_1129806 [Trichoderma longibrachiatum ATCC 18648]
MQDSRMTRVSMVSLVRFSSVYGCSYEMTAAWTTESSLHLTVGEHYQFMSIFPGWDHGIIGMAVGGERRLTVPAHLADSKNVTSVPSNCQLILDIRLLEISGESFEEADFSGYRADFELGAGKDGPRKEAFESETDRGGLPPSFRDNAEPQTTTERYDVEFVEAHHPAGMEKWLQETPPDQSGLLPRELSPTEADLARKKWGLVNDFVNRIRDAPTTSASAGLRPADQKAIDKPEPQGPLGSTATASSEGSKTLDSRPIGLPSQEVTAAPATLNVKKPKLVKSCTECRRRKLRCDRLFPCSRCIPANIDCRYVPDQKSANLPNGSDAEGAAPSRPSLMEALQQALERELEHSGMESTGSGFVTGGGEALQDKELPQTGEEQEPENAWGTSARSWGKRVEEPYSLLALPEETHQMAEYSREAERDPASSTTPSRSSETTSYKSANAEEDSPPRLRRVGHVQFDGIAGMGLSLPSHLDDAASEGAEEAGYPLSSSSAKATGNFEVGTPSRGLAKSGNPFRNPFVEGEDPAISETEKHTCTFPGCGKTVGDFKTHMISHSDERPEKCPFTTCEYHAKGFARRYDKNRHLFTHHNGSMLCGFCPGPGSGPEMAFNHLDAFKKHLFAVHGVEQTSLDGRRAGGSGHMAPKVLAYGLNATGICSICNQFFTNVQDFYEHLDDCVARLVQQINPTSIDGDGNERPQPLDTVSGPWSSGSEPRESTSAAQAPLRPHDEDDEEMLDLAYVKETQIPLDELEGNFMRDFTCCGKTLPHIHDLILHYHEEHK